MRNKNERKDIELCEVNAEITKSLAEGALGTALLHRMVEMVNQIDDLDANFNEELLKKTLFMNMDFAVGAAETFITTIKKLKANLESKHFVLSEVDDDDEFDMDDDEMMVRLPVTRGHK